MSTTASEGWQLEGASAEAYECYAVASWSRALAEQLVALAAPEPGERVLDVACGTGIVTRLAAQRAGEVDRVCGLDVNDEMLAAARAATSDALPHVDWRQGDVVAMPLDDESFDLVLCQQGMQFFPDRPAARCAACWRPAAGWRSASCDRSPTTPSGAPSPTPSTATPGPRREP